MNDTEFQPEVSVIVPNDNHAALFRERLESMLNQTYPYHEPIVLDDASSGTSVEVIHESLSAVKHHFFLNKTNSGSTFLQWNRALEMAKGEPIWIAESDDIADPTLLEKPLQTFGDNDVALAYYQSLAFNTQSEVTANFIGWTDAINRHLWKHYFVMDGTSFAVNFMSIKELIPNANAVLFKRSLSISPPSLRPDFKLRGDLLLWVSIMHGRKIAYVAKALNRNRLHETTVRHLQSSVYLSECNAMTRWIVDNTQVWNSPTDLCDLRQHILGLWFGIDLEPAAPGFWFKQQPAYAILFRFCGAILIPRLLVLLPTSAWRRSLRLRTWWSLGWRSVWNKLSKQVTLSYRSKNHAS
jgi:glycosyltransferase involved in cell wall biosynthesis